MRGDEQAATAELVGAGPGRNSQKAAGHCFCIVMCEGTDFW